MTFCIRRREFIAGLGDAAAWPVTARAQPGLPVIGFLGSESLDLYAGRLRAFHQGLGETGFVDGRNVAFEYRWAEGESGRFPALLADLVSRKVAVIVAVAGTPPALAAKAATATIPIVFTTAGDSIAAGLVSSLSRPGGNITGVTSLAVELGQKQLEVLTELVPAAKVIALLVNPANPSNADTLSRDLQAAARIRGVGLHVLHASTESDLDTVFATLPRLGAGALVIGSDPFFNTRPQQLVALAARHAVPTRFASTSWPAAWSATATALRTPTVWWAPMPAGFSRARNRPICRSSSLRRSNFSSILRLRRRSALPSHSRCASAPTRLSNKQARADGRPERRGGR